ncbi:glycosyltransferase family protein [Marinactinospora thermotolerans]|uniref:Predicted glycosyl transferase n=1 Tax=Marinactinospora thermotolerans DSM 45154 TaxID=1122192 RepID=A0A1T4QDI9_9ACTN|nr:glycosyltransferase [Marinactinospora thermotolerans]SKA01863.1 Predicted glycosyl transferase [Marinactinospora thermotolerans DSM 45154]
MTLDDVATPRPPRAAGDGPGRLRIALYSHDAQGLGHTRRNLALASALGALEPRPDVLLLTGAPEAAAFGRPPGCDVVGLPALGKDPDGEYAARHLSADLADLISLRSAILSSTLRSFTPDLLIVDKHPRGVFGELEPALRVLWRGPTRVVLGLRDVLDAPSAAAADWERARGTSALRRYYDAVWCYGDPTLSDPTADLGLPADLAARVTHTGYLVPDRGRSGAPAPMQTPFVLGLAGGGADGARLAEAFVSAPLPAGVHGVFVTGPHMPPARRRAVEALAAGRADMSVREFAPDLAPWLEHASAVVSMGGYNTVCEALAGTAPLLVVPRVRPRAEQLVRALRLAGAGLLDLLHPAALTPSGIGAWVGEALERPRRPRGGADLEGLARIPELARKLIDSPAFAPTAS